MTDSGSPDQEVSRIGVGNEPTATREESRDEESFPSGQKRARRSWGWHSVVLALMAVSLFAFMVLLPLIEHFYHNFQPQKAVSKIEPMSFGESIRFRVMQGLTGLWFFVFGGCIGSFLNVVAYRLPRGESIVAKPSSCPGCDSAIKLRDNLPVIGWLALGGRCRSCGMQIDIRYPVVETLAGVVFFLFFAFQLATGGANVPGVNVPAYSGVVWIIFHPKWGHISLYFYHCMLVSTILAFVLIDFDTQRLSWQRQVVAFLMILLPIALSPHLLSVHWDSISSNSALLARLQAVGLSLLGGIVGFWLGWACQRLLGDSLHAPSILACTGMGLGWQASVAVLLVTLCLRIVAWLPLKVIGIRFLPLSLWLFLGFVIHHIVWRWTIETSSPYWQGAIASLLGGSIVLAALVCLVVTNVLASNIEERPNAV